MIIWLWDKLDKTSPFFYSELQTNLVLELKLFMKTLHEKVFKDVRL